MNLEEVKKRIKKYSLNPKLNKLGEKIVQDILEKHKDIIISIFACGSVVEKLSDKYSDFDVRVITTNFEGKENYKINGTEVNILFFTQETIEREINHHNEVILRWIVNSVVLKDKENYVEKLRNRIINEIPELVEDFITRAYKAYQDSLGSFTKGDYESAIISARLAAFAMIQAALFAKGEFCTLERWLFKKFKTLEEYSKEEVDSLSVVLDLQQCDQKKPELYSLLFLDFLTTE